jgi:hypothetical protein
MMTPSLHPGQGRPGSSHHGRHEPFRSARRAGPRWRLRSALAVVVTSGLLLATGCGGGDDHPRARSGTTAEGEALPPGVVTTSTAPPAAAPILLSTQGGHLDAYEALPPYTAQRVATGTGADPDGVDLRGQICPFPDGTGRLVVAAGTARWTVLQLRGAGVGDLSAEPVGGLRLAPVPGESGEGAFGCGFLRDGRLVTTDVGDPSGARADGRLVLWFPPFTGDTTRSCTLDAGIGAPRALWVDDQDRIHVASGGGPGAGVWRYSGPYPTAPDAAGGCAGTDPAGEPQADRTRREPLIPAGADGLTSPTGIAGGPEGTLVVSSTAAGTIDEYDANGVFLRTLLRPPSDDPTRPGPPPTGTPLGLAVDPDGTVWYADAGWVPAGDGFTALPGAGSLRRLTPPTRGGPAPETVARGLDRPTGVTLLVPGATGGAASRA